ncbi:PDZ domain-containing protein [Mariniluteicoccus endophyticus]
MSVQVPPTTGDQPVVRTRAKILTRQTWTALTAALTFVGLALGLAFMPVPYVVYSPGRAYDVMGNNADGRPILQIERAKTYDTPGSLSMTTVAVSRSDARVSLPEVLLAYVLPKRDALPRDTVYADGQTVDQVRTEEKRKMDTSQQDAVVAALSAAGQPVESWPVVASVTVSGPANNRLRPSDLVLAVDGEPTHTIDDVKTAIARHTAGDVIGFTVWRDRREQQVSVTSTGRHSDAKAATVGVDLGTGYRYDQVVRFGINQEVGGPSAGLIFALGLYDKLTPEPLLAGRRVAGTGTIRADGTVGVIGGIHEKIASAEEAGATTFLVPAGNCRDLAGLSTKMDLIRADSLVSTVDALKKAAVPATVHEVPRCS